MNIKKFVNITLLFIAKRVTEIFGFLVLSAGIFLFVSLFSYSPEDPNFIFPENTEIRNLLGFRGSYISDIFFQSIGLIAYLVSFFPPFSIVVCNHSKFDLTLIQGMKLRLPKKESLNLN